MARPKLIARRYYVSGRVQGVGFRYFVQRAAQELGLQGYVKNRADGTVETYASGTPERLEAFKKRLWEGPGLSRVDNVQEHDAEPNQRTGFGVE
ncbi:MAG: acylphosphatase [Bryobacterales bacterium]